MAQVLDLLSLNDLSATDIEQLAERAVRLAELWTSRAMPPALSGARVGLMAELPGWRNPSALSLGVAEMGGTCVSVAVGLEGKETLEDLAGYFDNWFDVMAVRTPSLKTLRQFADHLNAPVINLRTHDNHPCEVLGDLSFILARRGGWQGLRVAMVGPAGNIAQSWIEAATVLPIDVVHVTSDAFAYDARDLPDRVRVSSDPTSITTADVIVTDCWPSEVNVDQRQDIARFRITKDMLDRGKPDQIFLPCPPVTRGEEVSADAMDHQNCLVTQAKAYLMHGQNAVLERVFAALK